MDARSTTTASLVPAGAAVSTIPAGLPTTAYLCNSDTRTAIYCTELTSSPFPIATYVWFTFNASMQTVTYTSGALHPMLAATTSSTASSTQPQLSPGPATSQIVASATSDSPVTSTASSTSSNTTGGIAFENSSHSSLSAGAAGAIGAVCGVLSILLLIGAFFLVRRKRRQRSHTTNDSAIRNSHMVGPEPYQKPELSADEHRNIIPTSGTAELATEHRRHQLGIDAPRAQTKTSIQVQNHNISHDDDDAAFYGFDEVEHLPPHR